MSSSALLFTSLILDLTAGNLLFATLLSSLITLCDYQFGVYGFFVFLLLTADDLQLCLFKDFHASLLKSLAAEYVQHRLDFRVEVEQLSVSLINLGLLAV